MAQQSAPPPMDLDNISEEETQSIGKMMYEMIAGIKPTQPNQARPRPAQPNRAGALQRPRPQMGTQPPRPQTQQAQAQKQNKVRQLLAQRQQNPFPPPRPMQGMGQPQQAFQQGMGQPRYRFRHTMGRALGQQRGQNFRPMYQQPQAPNPMQGQPGMYRQLGQPIAAPQRPMMAFNPYQGMF